MQAISADECQDKLLPMRSEDQFSDRRVQALIKAVQSRPGIWNMMAVDYKNRTIRPKLWRDITKELNIETTYPNINKVRKRWDQTRASYLRSKKNTGVLKPYKYAKLLSFLDGSVIPRPYYVPKIRLGENESKDLANQNLPNLHDQQEIAFEYVEIKQEPKSFITNDQQSSSEPSTSMSTIETKILFNEIKTESEDDSTPQLQSPGTLIKSYIKLQNNPIMIHRACQTEELVVKNATQDPKDELITALKRQNEQLKKRIVTEQTNYQFGKIPIESLEGQDRKVRFLTGFPNFETMELIYKDVEQKIPTGCRMSKFDVFFMTWMKLKLDFSLDYLSILMNLKIPTASRLFYATFVILYDRLSKYIVWPDGRNNREKTPISYKQIFGDRRLIIIDCFEFFPDRIGNKNNLTPSSAQNKDTVEETSKLKSQYRPVKYLIGFLTGGTIIYLSKPFDTRLSKNCIAQQSGFLDKIKTDDIILANSEFVPESVDKVNHDFKGIVPLVKNAEGELVDMSFEFMDEFSKIRENIARKILCMKQQIMVHTNRPLVCHITNKYGVEMYTDFVIKVACYIVNLTPRQVDM